MRQAAGLEYLAMVTDLLQRVRLASPEGGLWEAADIQWAWRRDQHADPSTATFWIEGSDVVAAAITTSWGEPIGLNLIVPPEHEQLTPMIFATALESVARLPHLTTAIDVDDDDANTVGLVGDAGFVPDTKAYVSCWLDAGNGPDVTDIAAGYRLRSRADATDAPHHMITRNGPEVAQRLLECSIYNPTLDLFVEAPDGSVAAYGLFWPDPVTGVGLVEPMRTEDEHQGRGLARHVLTAGVAGLAAAGCSRMKITYIDDNPISGHVYRSSGFAPTSFARTYQRPS